MTDRLMRFPTEDRSGGRPKIAEEFSFINARMREIGAERAASIRGCTPCEGTGWIIDRTTQARSWIVCPSCHNAKDEARPVASSA